MRISDWSSDVALPISAAQPHAAQELRRVRRVLGGVRRARSGGQPAPCRALVRSVARGPDRAARHRALCAGARRRSDRADGGAQDRTSVVEGKSVSVRVDLGGRRHLIKKNTYKHYYYILSS